MRRVYLASQMGSLHQSAKGHLEDILSRNLQTFQEKECWSSEVACVEMRVRVWVMEEER